MPSIRSTLLDISVILYVLYFFSTHVRNIKHFAITFSVFVLYGLLVNTIWQLNVPFIRTFSASLFFAFLGSIYFLHETPFL